MPGHGSVSEVRGHSWGQGVDREAGHDGLPTIGHHEAGLPAVRLGERGRARDPGQAEAAEAVGRGLEGGAGE